MNACSGSVCILQDICRVRSAEGGRVCAVEERWPPGWQRHTHHSPTCSDVAPPPLGPQCRRPLHRREWQTCASHTQVTTGGWVQHGHIQRAVSNFRTFKYFYELEKNPSLFTLESSHTTSLTPRVSCLVPQMCVSCAISRDGAADSVKDDGNRK